MWFRKTPQLEKLETGAEMPSEPVRRAIIAFAERGVIRAPEGTMVNILG